MTFKQDFHDYLTSRASIRDLFQDPATDTLGPRVFEGEIAQAAKLPAIAFRWAGGSPELCLDGEDDVAQRDLVIEVEAETPAQLDALTEAVRNVLSGFDGPMGGTTRVVIDLQDHDDDSTNALRDGDDEHTHTGQMMFDVWHTQAAPDFV